MRPRKVSFRQIYELYMVFIGSAAPISAFAQAYKTFTTQSANDLSMVANIVGLVTIISWLVYGIILRNPPLIISNIFGSIGAVVVIIGIILYS